MPRPNLLLAVGPPKKGPHSALVRVGHQVTPNMHTSPGVSELRDV